MIVECFSQIKTRIFHISSKISLYYNRKLYLPQTSQWSADHKIKPFYSNLKKLQTKTTWFAYIWGVLRCILQHLWTLDEKSSHISNKKVIIQNIFIKSPYLATCPEQQQRYPGICQQHLWIPGLTAILGWSPGLCTCTQAHSSPF